jgi:hypothetical protein
LVVAGYNTIKETVEKMIPVQLGVPTDIILAAVGYWKRDTWWGRGLLYGAIASLGREWLKGLTLLPAAGAGAAATPAAAPTAPTARILARYGSVRF